MRKLFENYAKRHGKDVNTLRFLLDGVRVSPDQTPEEVFIYLFILNSLKLKIWIN